MGAFSSIDVTNSTDTFKAVQVGNEIELTVESVGGPAQKAASPAQVMQAGMVNGLYGRGVAGGRRQFGAIVAPVIITHSLAKLPVSGADVPSPIWNPVAGMIRMGMTGFRPRDEFGSTGAGDVDMPRSMAISGVSAAAYNGMATMNLGGAGFARRHQHRLGCR